MACQLCKVTARRYGFFRFQIFGFSRLHHGREAACQDPQDARESRSTTLSCTARCPAARPPPGFPTTRQRSLLSRPRCTRFRAASSARHASQSWPSSTSCVCHSASRTALACRYRSWCARQDRWGVTTPRWWCEFRGDTEGDTQLRWLFARHHWHRAWGAMRWELGRIVHA